MNNQHIISIEGLKKHFLTSGGRFTAINGIDLNIGSAEFTGIVGPSGSGKTTLLNIIGSLDTPSEGKVVVLGKSIGELNVKQAALLRRSQLGFIFQSYNLLPVYTVFENVEFPLLLMNLTDNQRKNMVMDSLEWLGLTNKVKSKPSQLSGGESQRVAIARAMVKKPQIILADEPTANLDAANSHNILQMMVKLNQEFETTFIFATHDEKVIGYLKRKITLLDGKIASDETIRN
jgi:putative ABC transport system ATP-binding protein